MFYKIFYFFIFFFIVIVSQSCRHKVYDNPHIKIETEYGDIEAELYPVKAPQTVAAFLKNIKNKVYNKATFYRVLKNEELTEQYNSGLIQGGIYDANKQLVEKLPSIPHESPRQTGISHVSGTLSLARTEPGTAKSEFFICIGDQTQFDSSKRTTPDGLGYAAFGRVVKGMKIVRKIQALKNNGDKILYPAIIKKIIQL